MMVVNTKFSPEFQAKQQEKRAQKVRAQFLKDHPEIVEARKRETEKLNKLQLILKNAGLIRGVAWVQKVEALVKGYQSTGLLKVTALEKALNKSL